MKLTQKQFAQLTGETSRPKYRNVKQKTPDGTFDSNREFDRWAQLRILERAGLISALKRQVPYPIEINGVKVCTYVADFVYIELGQKIVEDAKGMRTSTYILKRKLMQAVHNITIKEV